MKRKIFWAVLAGFAVLPLSAQNRGQGRSVAYYEELVGTLTNQVRLLQDENAKLAGTVSALKQSVRTLEQRMQSLSSETAELRRMVASESDARNKQLGKIADQIQKAGQAAEQQAAAAAKQAAEQQAVAEVSYYEVQPGATLTAISKATGVSVAELKKANGLTSDVLRVGQKLKIPGK